MSAEHKHTCEQCSQRKARFSYRGVVKADRHHTLCFACYRSQRDRTRAALLASVAPAARQNVVLSPVQRAHRFRMLAHLRTLQR